MGAAGRPRRAGRDLRRHTAAETARAALEGIAWRVADIVEAIRETVAVDSLRVDGGLTNEPLMLELQADAIGARVEAAGADATVLGAAALAAVGSGTIGSLGRLAGGRPSTARSNRGRDTAWRAAKHVRWREFVQATAALDPPRRAGAAGADGASCRPSARAAAAAVRPAPPRHPRPSSNSIVRIGPL